MVDFLELTFDRWRLLLSEGWMRVFLPAGVLLSILFVQKLLVQWDFGYRFDIVLQVDSFDSGCLRL